QEWGEDRGEGHPSSLLSPALHPMEEREFHCCDGGAVPPPTGGFFFHGISGNFVGTLTFCGGDCAICSSESTGGASPGGAMFPFHEAMRACKPWCSAVFWSPAFI